MPALLLIAATERELCAVEGVKPVCCGIGPVEAGLATASALNTHSAARVLHVGIAGATGLGPGSVVIGSESIYCDVLDRNSTLPRIARVRPSETMLAAALTALPEAIVLPIATSGRVGGGREHQVEAMEGFGVLRASELAGVAAIEIRVISNNPAETDRSQWHIEDALAVLHDTIRSVVPALLNNPTTTE